MYEKQISEILNQEKPQYLSPLDNELLLTKNYKRAEDLALYMASIFYEAQRNELPTGVIKQQLNQYAHSELKKLIRETEKKKNSLASYFNDPRKPDSYLVTAPIIHENQAVSYRLFYKKGEIASIHTMFLESEHGSWKLKGDWLTSELPKPLLIKNPKVAELHNPGSSEPIYFEKQKIYTDPRILARDYSSLVYEVYQGKKKWNQLDGFCRLYSYEQSEGYNNKFKERMEKEGFIPIENSLYELKRVNHSAYFIRSLKDEKGEEYFFFTELTLRDGAWKITRDELTPKPDFLLNKTDNG
ncbi:MULTISPECIES: hypothetical protein [Pseudobacillus]|uniref:hypothetical protein n=1 Tax=Pseudobacillus TaxID=108525 RepID=UPI00387A182B